MLTPEERDTLLAVAKSFDERPADAPPPDEAKPFTSGKAGGNRPGDLCEQREDWTDLLTSVRWRYVGGTAKRQHWQRPGKGEHDRSVSATLNAMGLFVFSTSTALPVGKPLNKFAFLAFTKFDGNFQAAAKALAERYGLDDLDDAAAEIERLASLDKLEYFQQRKEVAKKLGLNVTDFDKLVGERRAEAEGIKAMGFEETEPAAEPQDAAALMSDIYLMVKRHIVCQDATAIAATLWILTSWFSDVIDCAPIALITAPEKRAGKTQLLTVMSRLVYRPLASAGITPAVLFRLTEAYHPTLLIDEADAFLTGNEELRGFINAGHTRATARAYRCEGDNHLVRAFDCFGPKAIAGIGTQAETIMDRSIIIELRRRRDDEPIMRLDETTPEVWTEMRSRLRRFADDNREQVKAARPILPDGLNDRERDNWRPLLAIAELAGAETAEAVANAAMAISGNSNKGEESAQVQLLKSVRGLFQATGCARLGSKQVVELLKRDGQSIWPSFDHGKPVTERQVATLLKNFKIEAKRFRDDGGSQLRGYALEDFKESFERYLSKQQPDEYVNDGTPFVPIGADQQPAVALGGQAIQ